LIDNVAREREEKRRKEMAREQQLMSNPYVCGPMHWAVGQFHTLPFETWVFVSTTQSLYFVRDTKSHLFLLAGVLVMESKLLVAERWK